MIAKSSARLNHSKLRLFSPQWIQQLILSHYKASSKEEPVELLDHDRIGWKAGWHWATGTTHLVHQASTWWTTSGVAPSGLQERALASMHRPPAWSPASIDHVFGEATLVGINGDCLKMFWTPGSSIQRYSISTNTGKIMWI